MKNETDENKRIDALLGSLPERELPCNLGDQIMARIVELESPSLRDRLKNICKTLYPKPLQPLSYAVMATALVAAFFLGSVSSVPYGEGGLPRAADMNSEASYYIGRGLYESGNPEEALVYLERAAVLDPGKPEYGLWRAVALQAVGDSELERKQYQRLVSKYPEYLPALINLGHNQLESGDLDGALATYGQILSMNPQEQNVLYNIGLIYKMKGEVAKENRVWQQYLTAHRTGMRSYRAVSHLNEAGSFAFRTAQLGYRRIVIRPEALFSDNKALRDQEVSWLAAQFMRSPGRILNLVVFDAKGQDAARERARLLQEELLSRLPENKQVHISWFGQAEIIAKKDTQKSALKRSILVFSQPDNLTTLKERRI